MEKETLIIQKTCEVYSLWSLKNYTNLSGFPMAFISTYQTEFPPPFVASSLYRGVLVCHKQRVEVFYSNLSIERSWVPFRCWVSLFLTGFTSRLSNLANLKLKIYFKY
jgi:hypothetical protein